MPSTSTCSCASLPNESIGLDVDTRPDLHGALERIDTEQGLAVYFRCRVCGTYWETNLASAMHASVPIFRRSELDEYRRPERVLIDLATGVRAPLRR